ncbi:MAG: thiol-disulfide isomerase/thioredoxin [Bacillariaceae sp.]|jgi:thiol-disulfide isomerase/thioredoxin
MTSTTTSNNQKRRVPFLFYAFLAVLQQQQSHSVTVAAFGSSLIVQNRRIPTDGSSRSVDIISRNAALVDTNDINPAGNVKKGISSRVNKFLRSKQLKNKNQSVVQEVKDIDSIRNLLGQGRDEDTYTAVIFHAPFCKACRASLPLFEALAKQYSNNSNSNNNNIGSKKKHEEEQKQIIPNVKFLSVPVTQDNSKQLQEYFAVTRFPLAHIYDPQRGLIDERPVLKKMFPKFEERLESVVVKSTSPLSLSMTNNTQ